MTWRRRSATPPTDSTPESELLLFGGPLRYDQGWNAHDDQTLQLGLRAVVRRLPHLLAVTVRLAWQADKRALQTVAVAEIGRGVAQAIGLVAVNHVLAALLADGTMADRLRDAGPALWTVTVTALIGALLTAASTAHTGRLEPKIERLATERYLGGAARVEMAAVEDDDFHRLLDSAQHGAGASRRMLKYCTSVVNALLSLIAAASVLTVLHPLLLPLLVTMTLPRAWATLTIARRHYASWHTWTQHTRAGHLLGRLLISTDAAAEIRVHGVGPFLLTHYRSMASTAVSEQTRLARLAARTGLVAAALTGIATAAVYLTLGGLLWTGAMSLSVAGTAVLAIRTGSASLDNVVVQINYLNGEAMFVGDLERLAFETTRRAIPTGGLPLPKQPTEILFEDVTFTYPGTDSEPSLERVSLTIPTGKIVALVGENGSGKSTLIKLLCGLYAPDSGHIRWDDIDTAHADRHQLFSRVAVVGQDFYRWPFTAKVNIAIGRSEVPVTDERLDVAAAYADAEAVIDGLPRGWDTLLARGYRGGHQLSGGQWQRLSIARARYRDADILIVDEPTAALDARAEQQVFDQIQQLAAHGQTIVLITHRLASVRHADVIHVLKDGRLAETGDFHSLMHDETKPGIFRSLYRLQARQYQPDKPAVATQSVGGQVHRPDALSNGSPQ
ncbi:ABC transporter ATP-binding protein [Streptomyces sp. NPDC059679]|uniref:ABC transporter ATP-binding protein n=1 Tax=Streptomyces sp. NPDC059679 TaxID=3346903 RepID=UPI0036AF6242